MGQRTIEVTGECVYRPGDEAGEALLAAYEGNAVVDICFMDAPGGAGSEGKRGDFYVEKWERTEPLDGAVMIAIAFARTNEGGHILDDYTFPA